MRRTTHAYTLNPTDNAGEAIYITTDITFDPSESKKEQVTLEHRITLNSYGNSATLNIDGVQITPAKLRLFADELQAEIDKITNNK